MVWLISLPNSSHFECFMDVSWLCIMSRVPVWDKGFVLVNFNVVRNLLRGKLEKVLGNPMELLSLSVKAVGLVLGTYISANHYD